MKEKATSLKQYKLMFLLLTFVFILTLFVNITFSWFYNNSEIFTSVTIGSLDVESYFVGVGSETFESSELLSGEIIERSFQIDNLITSEECYVRIKGVFSMDYDENGTFVDSPDVQMTPATTETDWTQGLTGGFVEEEFTEYWYYYNNVLTVNESSVVSLVIDLDFTVYPTLAGESYGIGNEDAGKDFEIIVYVEVIQASNNAYEVAWAGDQPFA